MVDKDLAIYLESGVKLESNEHKITDFRLRQHTAQIERLMVAMKRNMFEIAARLKAIRDDELYRKDGFSSVYDYALKVLGYKENYCRKLITACEKFIESDTSGKGKIYFSCIRHETMDYTVLQLVELNSLETAEAKELDANEVISPLMTVREIRAVVKQLKNGEIDLQGHDLTLGQYDDEEETDSGGEAAEAEITTADVCKQIIAGIDEAMKDERIIRDVITAAKFAEFKKFINGLNL